MTFDRRRLTTATAILSLAAGAAWFLKPGTNPIRHDGLGAFWLATGILWLAVARRHGG